MSETKHTPEPWNLIQYAQVYSKDRLIADCRSWIPSGIDTNNAERIVACVNACKGIPTEVLSDPEYSVKQELDSLDAQIESRIKAEKERDELKGLLKDVHKILDSFSCETNEDSESKSFFKAELNEDSFFIVLNQVRKVAE